MPNHHSPRANFAATGVALLAASMLIVTGLVQVVNGIIGIGNDVILARVGAYIFRWDSDVWGWIHLLLGLFFVATGLCLYLGQEWARSVGIGLAIVSVVFAFMWMPYYPLASIVIIALDVVVIWALATYDIPAL